MTNNTSRRPTIKDIARIAGVSIATVSYVFNDTKHVSDEVRQRVLKSADHLGYKVNKSARTLRTGTSKTIGLVLPDLTNPFFPEIAQAVEAEARLNGFATILFDTQGLPELETRAIELLAEYRVDGVVWALIGASPAEQPPFPTVLIDRPVEGFDGVYTDHARGGQLAAELAGSLGHSRLGLLSGPQDVASAAMRRAGFMSKLTPGSKIVWEEPVPFGRDLPSAAVSALERNEVSFIFAANDLVALSAMAVLERAKIDVPEEVSVLGYDDISWAELPQIALSTIRQPLPDLGRAAFQLLQQRMDQPGRDIAHMMLEPCVQTRSTTR